MELQPCPFCAAKAEFNQTEDGGHFIECTICRSSTSLRYSLMEDAKPILAEGWNRRAGLAAAPVAAQEPPDQRTVAQIAHEVHNKCERIPGANFYTAAEMALEQAIAIIAAPVAAQEPTIKLDAAALEAATMALLHKESNPAPGVDWLASRNGTVTQWKERVCYAITAYLAAAPVAAQEPAGTLHDDGHFTWKGTGPTEARYAGWRADFYLAAPVAAQEPDEPCDNCGLGHPSSACIYKPAPGARQPDAIRQHIEQRLAELPDSWLTAREELEAVLRLLNRA